MAPIQLTKISKRFEGSETDALSALDLTISDGEFVVLVGPSGCGKTTLLRIVAGLEIATAGDVHIGGKDVSNVRPGDRDIAMVFQNYALFPHLTVEENIGFGLRIRGTAKAERRERVVEAAELLGLAEYLQRRPGELSGGQRQRVAMGRAIVRRPAAFLMDEPLSNLDAKLRVEMRAEISRLQKTLATTTIYVTHDQIEAMTMGDRVVVLKDGLVQQVASPAVLYEHPANLFVGTFIGAPTMNLLQGKWSAGDLYVNDRRLRVDVKTTRPRVGDVIVGARPEHVRIVPAERDSALVTGRVGLVENLGKEAQVYLDLKRDIVATDDAPFIATAEPGLAPEEEATVGIELDTAKIHLFDPASGASFIG